MKNVRVVVGGFLANMSPAGGVVWDYVQYPLGFHEMGCDVYYVEDTRLWPIFRPDSDTDHSARQNIAYLKGVMEDFGMGDRWAYRDEVSGDCFGLPLEKVKEICRTADVFVNISCASFMRDEYREIPVRVLIDSDPMFTQIQYHGIKPGNIPGDPGLRKMMEAHNNFFTFGENVGAEDCRMPDCGIEWKPTRQPVSVRHWPVTPLPALDDGKFTSVMNWTAGPPLIFEDEPWLQKNVEMERFKEFPKRVPGVPLAVAIGQTGGTGDAFPMKDFVDAGWDILDPHEHVSEYKSYRRFIEGSFGEFAIAKQTYVKARTGWFSCRAACYLAAGRPVVNQDTGWSKYLPTGEGLFAFDGMDDAATAVEAIVAEPDRHAKGARRVAEECFASEKVLGELLQKLSG